jgi:hypothetical protein
MVSMTSPTMSELLARPQAISSVVKVYLSGESCLALRLLSTLSASFQRRK